MALLALAVAACAQTDRTPTGTTGAAAPDFSVRTFDNDDFRLSDHEGTPVVLNFWESW